MFNQPIGIRKTVGCFNILMYFDINVTFLFLFHFCAFVIFFASFSYSTALIFTLCILHNVPYPMSLIVITYEPYILIILPEILVNINVFPILIAQIYRHRNKNKH